MSRTVGTNKPLIFISHKYIDRVIANVVRSLITEQSAGNVRVFQSSDPEAIAPRLGRNLNAELRQALWEASAVILVYTSPDHDWGYCMWECGVATRPDSPDSRVIVLQCSDTVPSLFAGQVTANARDKADVEKFVCQFMTAADFLPGSTGPLTGYHKSDPQVQRAANKFFEDLKAVLLTDDKNSEWPAHPFVQLQLTHAAARNIVDAPTAQRSATARGVVLSEAVVSDSDKYVPGLFGLSAFPEALTLKTLVDTWHAAYPKRSDVWIESLTDQVGKAVQQQLPGLRWTAMSSIGDRRSYAPVLTRVRNLPAAKMLRFDVYFYPFNLLDATPAASRMVRPADMFCREIPPGGEGAILIFDLLRDLEEAKYNRLPFVDSSGRLVYIAHRSMLDQFVARKVGRGESGDIARCSLANVLEEKPEVRSMFTTTAAFIGEEATLGDAKLAMAATRNCYDVFVTETGDRKEPVLGWITDVIIADSEPDPSRSTPDTPGIEF